MAAYPLNPRPISAYNTDASNLAGDFTMPKKPTKAGSPEPPAEPVEPAAQHLHDEQRRPLKAPISGIPPNLPEAISRQRPQKLQSEHGQGPEFPPPGPLTRLGKFLSHFFPLAIKMRTRTKRDLPCRVRRGRLCLILAGELERRNALWSLLPHHLNRHGEIPKSTTSPEFEDVH